MRLALPSQTVENALTPPLSQRESLFEIRHLCRLINLLFCQPDS